MQEEKERLTVGNHTREELEMIIMGGASLHPTRITFTCKIQRTVIRRLASAFSTFHFFAHLICGHKSKNNIASA